MNESYTIHVRYVNGETSIHKNITMHDVHDGFLYFRSFKGVGIIPMGNVLVVEPE